MRQISPCKARELMFLGERITASEADKSSSDVEALDAGVIEALLAGAGDTVEVGAVVATLAEGLSDALRSHPGTDHARRNRVTGQATDRAIQTMGGMGYSTEAHVERLWRDALLFRIAPVSEEMVLNFVAQHDLGMPRSY